MGNISKQRILKRGNTKGYAALKESTFLVIRNADQAYAEISPYTSQTAKINKTVTAHAGEATLNHCCWECKPV